MSSPNSSNLLKDKKILCVCEHGNSRSVGLAWILKDVYHYDALSCGAVANLPETLEVLFNWADIIIVMDKRLAKNFPYPEKLLVFDVGYDRYFKGIHPELINQCLDYLKEYIPPEEFKIP